jgi:DNA-directed RNA polymerase subunit K/omega
MRSDDVFAAAKNISNRFLLCRVAAVSARHLQQGPKQSTESINKSFKLIASMSAPQDENGAGEFLITF